MIQDPDYSTSHRRGIVITNAHLLGSAEREGSRLLGQAPQLRVRLEGTGPRQHSWHDATVLYAFSGEAGWGWGIGHSMRLSTSLELSPGSINPGAQMGENPQHTRFTCV